MQDYSEKPMWIFKQPDGGYRFYPFHAESIRDYLDYLRNPDEVEDDYYKNNSGAV